MTAVWGRIVTVNQVRLAVERHLQRWFVPYLAELERQHGLPAQSVPPPKSWQRVSTWQQVREDQMPNISVTSPGTVSKTTEETGLYRITWDIQVFLVVRGSSHTETADRLGLYTAAANAAVAQHPTLGDTVSDAVIGDFDDYGVLDANSARTIAGAVVPLLVAVDEALDASAGPDEPPVDPYAVPADPTPIDRLTVEVEPFPHPANE